MQDYKTPTSTPRTTEQSNVDKAKEVAGQAADQAKSVVGQAVDQAKSAAAPVVDQAKETANTQFVDKKEQAADSIGAVADTLRQTTEQLRGQNVGPLIGLAGTAADQLEDLSRYLRDSNVEDLVREVEGFARRQPVLFLSGAFAIGLLAARFLKSSAPEPEYPDYYDTYARQPASSYPSSYGTGYPTSYGAGYRPSGTMGQASPTGYADYPSDYGSRSSGAAGIYSRNREG